LSAALAQLAEQTTRLPASFETSLLSAIKQSGTDLRNTEFLRRQEPFTVPKGLLRFSLLILNVGITLPPDAGIIYRWLYAVCFHLNIMNTFTKLDSYIGDYTALTIMMRLFHRLLLDMRMIYGRTDDFTLNKFEIYITNKRKAWGLQHDILISKSPPSVTRTYDYRPSDVEITEQS
jgi:hypothetical protein